MTLTPGWQALYGTNNPGEANAKAAAGLNASSTSAQGTAAATGIQPSPPVNPLGGKQTATQLPSTDTTPDPNTVKPTTPVIPDTTTDTSVVPDTTVKPADGTTTPTQPLAPGPPASGTTDTTKGTDNTQQGAVATSTQSNPPAAPPPTPYDAVISALTTMATSNNDPQAAVAFNQAISQMGQQNQAAQQALQQKINSDPTLAGQPAGKAFISLAARDAGITESQVIAGLDSASIARITAMNQYGLSALPGVIAAQQSYQTNQLNTLLNAGDYTGYAAMFKSLYGTDIDPTKLSEQNPVTIQAGTTLLQSIKDDLTTDPNDKSGVAAQKFAQLQKLLPDVYGSLTLNDVINGAAATTAHDTQHQTLLTSARLNLSQVPPDTAGALADLQNAFPESTAAPQGDAIVNSIGTPGGPTLASVVQSMKDAGMDTTGINSPADLVGRGDDVFIASQMSQIKTANATPLIQQQSTDLAKDLGFDPTNVAEQNAIKAFIINGGATVNADGTYTINPGSTAPPWDQSNAAAYLFTGWPQPNGSGGFTGSDMSENLYTSGNPKPAPGTPLGNYTQTLDTGWQNFQSQNPSSTLTRAQWFTAVMSDPKNFSDGNPDSLATLTLGPNGTLSTGSATPGSTGTITKADGTTVPGSSATIADNGSLTIGSTTFTTDSADVQGFVTTYLSGSAAQNVANLNSNPALMAYAKEAEINGSPLLSDFTNGNNVPTSGAALKSMSAAGGLAEAIGPDGKSAVYTVNANKGIIHGSGIGDGIQVTGTDGKTYVVLNGTGIVDSTGLKAGVAYPTRMAPVGNPGDNNGVRNRADINPSGQVDPSTPVLQIENPPGSGNWYAIVDNR